MKGTDLVTGDTCRPKTRSTPTQCVSRERPLSSTPPKTQGSVPESETLLELSVPVGIGGEVTGRERRLDPETQKAQSTRPGVLPVEGPQRPRRDGG